MMTALERVSLLMTLIRRLEASLDRETALLKGLRVQHLAELQAEKASLVEAYERALRDLRRSPQLLGDLGPEVRLELEAATRRLQGRIRANVTGLAAAKQVVEGVVRHLGENLGAAANGGYGAPRGNVIPVTFSERV